MLSYKFFCCCLLNALFCWLLCVNHSYSQIPDWVWAKGAGTMDNDFATSIKTDANGNVYVVANYFNAPVTFDNVTLGNAGAMDVCILKFNPTGNLLWARNAGGNGNDYSYSLDIDNEGNLIIGGFTSSSVMILDSVHYVSSNGYYDIFIAKYNPHGSPIWINSFGGVNNELSFSLCAGVDSSIYVSGTFESPYIPLGSDTIYNQSITNPKEVFLIKFDRTGNIIWAKSFGGLGNDEGNSVCCDKSGNVLLAGNFKSQSITIDSTALWNKAVGNNDVFLAKFNSQGHLIWAKSEGGDSFEELYDIASDDKNNVYMSGNFASKTITLGNNTFNNYSPTGWTQDIFLIKYDSLGNLSWAKTAGGQGLDWATCVKVDNNENVYLAGSFSSPSINFLAHSFLNSNGGSTYDLFITKFFSDGNFAWAKTNGGNIHENIHDICIDINGNIYAAGGFNSHLIELGPVSLSSTSNYYDIFFGKLGSANLGSSNMNFSIAINSNPVYGNFAVNIFSSKSSTINLKCFNIHGQKIFLKNDVALKEGENKIEFTDIALAGGMYFVVASDETLSVSEKFIVLR